MYTIISPAKNQAKKITPPDLQYSSVTFPQEIIELVGLIKHYSEKDLENLMTVSSKIASLNLQRFANFNITDLNCPASYPAGFLFQGDVYKKLDVASWSDADCEYGQIHLGILSGLYGWLRILDKIQYYRLEMKTKLSNQYGANLYQFWGDKISKAIADHMHNNSLDSLVNLASQEYFKVINIKTFPYAIIQVDFKEQGPNGLRIVAVKAKRARGAMARFIVKNKVSDINGLKFFCEDRYQFSKSHSQEHHLVFIQGQ